MKPSAIQLPRELRGKGLRELARFQFGNLNDAVARVKNPAVAGVEEVIDAYLYDSFSVAAGAAFPKTTLFQNPVGAGGTKTLAMTNMRQAGHLESNDRFQVFSLQVYVANNTIPSDLQNILTNVSCVLTVRTKPYFEGPVLLLPAGCGGIVTAAAQTGTAAVGDASIISTSNGQPSPQAIHVFGDPIPITGEESFNVVLNPETGFSMAAAAAVNPLGHGTQIYVIMAGKRTRAVS